MTPAPHPFHADRPGPYRARSASDKTDDWPRWLVVGADGVNCVRWEDQPLALFMPRDVAERCAAVLNGEGNR